MKTRVGKIARLPCETREKLNLRLLNGELSTTVLAWINELPETNKLLNSVFAGNPISKQNLSEWRQGGYQDWLRHQHRQENFRHLSEQGAELENDEGSGDLFENFSRIMAAEMAEDINQLHELSNRKERWQRLREISRELVRLQHGYNLSRKTELYWDKWKSSYEYRSTRQRPQKPPPAPPANTAPPTANPPANTPKSAAVQSLAVTEPEPRTEDRGPHASRVLSEPSRRGLQPTNFLPLNGAHKNGGMSVRRDAQHHSPEEPAPLSHCIVPAESIRILEPPVCTAASATINPPANIEETSTVKPGQTTSNQNNTSAPPPSSPRQIHHRKCRRHCICKQCHPDHGPYPHAQAVKDSQACASSIQIKPPYPIIRVHCACPCDCTRSAPPATSQKNTNSLTADARR